MATADWVELTERLLDEHCQQSCLYIGCSGGLDSMVLLDLVVTWQRRQEHAPEIHIVHVNHGLSGNAKFWEQCVKAASRRYDVHCHLCSVTVNHQPRHSLEAAARDARYAAFFDTIPSNSTLLLAHHLDDQVETVLLRLLRGSGPSGLAAMATHTERRQGGSVIAIVRPLLGHAKTKLQSYAIQNKLDWVDDESNDDMGFDRNFLRHKVIDTMAAHWHDRWPGMQNAIARSASLCAQQQTALTTLLNATLTAVRSGRYTLVKSAVRAQTPEVSAELLRHWLSDLDMSMPSHVVMQTLRAALHSRHDASPVVCWAEHEIRVHGDTVYALPNGYTPGLLASELVAEEPVHLQTAVGLIKTLTLHVTAKGAELTLTNGSIQRSVVLPHVEGQKSLQLRNELSQFSVRFNASQPPRGLHRFFKEWDIAPWHRANIVGVWHNDRLQALILDTDIKVVVA
ncbi:tRNA lysidine(34) synthetase TilS [Alteromonas oceanisediminis]|uniref:tRNA lysidine(34) synthetase TilS n=1 Tax=Alteromonas oceanisediminis TaxID=2836180 RepID=UPI001BDB2B65|nr:tRNA lysidine(34) synthetase TilS [Alteromonas oceanisediminis]MBT0584998.1 tRNA lysidine(34) synthetase TilS [Alteromonas oceanisediminis]